MNPRGRRQRLSNIQQIADELRQSGDVATPDLTGSILDAVDAERPFLSLKTRRMVYAGRFAIGFAVVALVGAVALAHRISPGMFDLSGRPAPLSAVVENVKCEAQVKLADLQKQMQTVAVSEAEPVTASSQVFFSLVAPKSSAKSLSMTCTMVGPTMPPGVAARQCDNSAESIAPCCAYKPLAGIRRLSGGLTPTQSDWRISPMLGSTASGSSEVDSPLLLDQDVQSTLSPK